MDKQRVLIGSESTLPPIPSPDGHPDYAYTRRILVKPTDGRQCAVAFYEISPGKSAYPYHWHVMNEEVFYIIRGEGLLQTPEGVRPVAPGDLIYFPACEAGAHKLTNTSQTQPLAYIDFDIVHSPEICFYPDSKKIGVFTKSGLSKIFRQSDEADYFDGE